MLQLPEGAASPGRTPNPRKRAGTPITSEIYCPVLKLLVEYESLIATYNKIDAEEHTDQIVSDLAEIEKHMEGIAAQVMNMTAKSFDGAIFQMMLAYNETHTMVRSATLIERDEAHERFTRYMYRALERIGCDFDWTETRNYFCPAYCDPRKEGAK